MEPRDRPHPAPPHPRGCFPRWGLCSWIQSVRFRHARPQGRLALSLSRQTAVAPGAGTWGELVRARDAPSHGTRTSVALSARLERPRMAQTTPRAVLLRPVWAPRSAPRGGPARPPRPRPACIWVGSGPFAVANRKTLPCVAFAAPGPTVQPPWTYVRGRNCSVTA